jgi:hypothetical protein
MGPEGGDPALLAKCALVGARARVEQAEDEHTNALLTPETIPEACYRQQDLSEEQRRESLATQAIAYTSPGAIVAKVRGLVQGLSQMDPQHMPVFKALEEQARELHARLERSFPRDVSDEVRGRKF